MVLSEFYPDKIMMIAILMKLYLFLLTCIKYYTEITMIQKII